jgi:hypothetical protein
MTGDFIARLPFDPVLIELVASLVIARGVELSLGLAAAMKKPLGSGLRFITLTLVLPACSLKLDDVAHPCARW